MKTLHRHLNYLSIIALTILTSGCANLMSINHRFNTENGESISIDAKQRVVVSGKRNGENFVTCAEPSPDALSAISASQSLNLEVAMKALGFGASTSESAAYIGLRTTTIQLLRDAMYRVCEGYAAGALTEARFHRLQRHYQTSMISLLAIEQLTGAVSARPAALNSTAGADRGKLLLQAKEAVESATEAQDDALAAQKKADKALADAVALVAATEVEIANIDKDATKTAAQKTADKVPLTEKLNTQKATIAPLTTKTTEAKAGVVTAESDLKAANEFRADARNSMALNTSATANVYFANASSRLTPAAIEKLGNSVENIVRNSIRTNYLEEVCTGYLIYLIDDVKDAEKTLTSTEKKFLLQKSTSADVENAKEKLTEAKQRQNTVWKEFATTCLKASLSSATATPTL